MDDFVIQSTSWTPKYKESNDISSSENLTRKVFTAADDGDALRITSRSMPRDILLPPLPEEARRRSDKEQNQRHDHDVVLHDVHPIPTRPKPNVTNEEREQKEQEESAATRRTSLPESFKPTPYTVIIGRHSEAKTNLGNKRLQILASNYLSHYSAAQNRRIKTAIVNEIRETILNADGMFIVKNREDKTDKRWYHASDAVVREKIGYVLRDLLSHMYRSSSRAKVERKRLRKKAEGGEVAAGTRTTDSSFLHCMSPDGAIQQQELVVSNFTGRSSGEDCDKNVSYKNAPKTMEIFGRVLCAPACSALTQIDDEILPRSMEITSSSSFTITSRRDNTMIEMEHSIFGEEFLLLDESPKGQMSNVHDTLQSWTKSLD
eukprot:Nitzschia sp. Nitz4//scaffold313_size41840//4027//5154//NITZ4_007429-RA/size41840-processed-gene-0.0-mRNA-1//1//CDS//3329547409//8873//frame0